LVFNEKCFNNIEYGENNVRREVEFKELHKKLNNVYLNKKHSRN